MQAAQSPRAGGQAHPHNTYAVWAIAVIVINHSMHAWAWRSPRCRACRACMQRAQGSVAHWAPWHCAAPGRPHAVEHMQHAPRPVHGRSCIWRHRGGWLRGCTAVVGMAGVGACAVACMFGVPMHGVRLLSQREVRRCVHRSAVRCCNLAQAVATQQPAPLGNCSRQAEAPVLGVLGNALSFALGQHACRGARVPSGQPAPTTSSTSGVIQFDPDLEGYGITALSHHTCVRHGS